MLFLLILFHHNISAASNNDNTFCCDRLKKLWGALMGYDAPGISIEGINKPESLPYVFKHMLDEANENKSRSKEDETYLTIRNFLTACICNGTSPNTHLSTYDELDGFNALQLAVLYDDHEFASFLLDNGAKFKIKSRPRMLYDIQSSEMAKAFKDNGLRLTDKQKIKLFRGLIKAPIFSSNIKDKGVQSANAIDVLTKYGFIDPTLAISGGDSDWFGNETTTPLQYLALHCSVFDQDPMIKIANALVNGGAITESINGTDTPIRISRNLAQKNAEYKHLPGCYALASFLSEVESQRIIDNK